VKILDQGRHTLCSHLFGKFLSESFNVFNFLLDSFNRLDGRGFNKHPDFFDTAAVCLLFKSAAVVIDDFKSDEFFVDIKTLGKGYLQGFFDFRIPGR
jgi:hypothetical protein